MSTKVRIGAAVLFGLAVGMVLPSVLPRPGAQAAQEEKTPKWDFKVIRFYGLSNEQKTKQLNALGDAGWQYVGLLSTNGNADSGEVAFKRVRK